MPKRALLAMMTVFWLVVGTLAASLATAQGESRERAPSSAVPPPDTGATAPLTDVLQDGSFEAGTPNPVWQESSTNFGTPLCSDLCGLPLAHTGEWWAWFGGVDETGESASLSQTLIVPRGEATLSFWLHLYTAEVPGTFEVTMDDIPLFAVTEADAATYPDYTLVSLDASAFADGQTHTLGFSATTESAAPYLSTSFFVDDVMLDVDDGTTGVQLATLNSGPAPSALPFVGAMLGALLTARLLRRRG